MAGIVTTTYPPGCREINNELGTDELIRRLKTLAHTFQSLSQADDESSYAEYTALAVHMTDDYFLHNPSRDVQLLIACCIADILRIFAPEAPYKEPAQIKVIFLFLIRQLGGLKDPKDPAFKRYFYLLENLAYVKSFNMCFDLEESTEIFVGLFQLMFKIVNDEHSGKVKNFILEVLCPLITEADYVSNELLDIVLQNICDPMKTQKKNACSLAKELILKTSDTLEPYIQQFFNQVLILGKSDAKLNITRKVYDLIYELNHVCPSVLLAVLPQLEFKLKSTEETERMGSVSLLARMFSEKDSVLATNHRQLWNAFLGRFNDISVSIRIKCVQYTMHFLINHPELIDDITETLNMRQHDSEENVRYEVVIAIVSTAKKDFDVVSRSEDLLNFVKERTLDKKFKIRKEAMSGLAMIYKKHLTNPMGVPEATKQAVKWIKEKILHGYYMPGIEDRLVVERLLNTSLVPYSLESKDRMKKLYLLFATIDENASKAFIEVQKHQMQVRKAVGEVVELFNTPPTEQRASVIGSKVLGISKFLPEPVKVHEFIKKLAKHMESDEAMLRLLGKVTEPDVTCKESMESVNLILKKLGAPIMTNLYYGTVKQLLERISSVMVDREAIKHLVEMVKDALSEGNIIEELGLTKENAHERGLRLLFVLSFVFPSHFVYRDVLKDLLSMLGNSDDKVAPLVLSILAFIGKHRPISKDFPDLQAILVQICTQFIKLGTPKQAKQAIKCLVMNIKDAAQTKVFMDILEIIKENLKRDQDKHYLTAIVALGHIAFHLPEQFSVQVKNTVSRKIVKDLVMKDNSPARAGGDAWCERDKLCMEAQCKMAGMKMMARWLLGLKTDDVAAQKTFRMLNAIIENNGDLLEEGKPSHAEKAWLRLSAGCAMLKICEQKGVGDQFTTEQFYNLSKLIIDPVEQVREKFLVKLHKGLGRGIPHKCLPLDFMGLYVMMGLETDKRLRGMAKQFMLNDINKRKEYIKLQTMNSGLDKLQSQLPHIMPDYMLVFAVAVLTHDPNFLAFNDVEYLKKLRQALWFIMEPLMIKNEHYSFGFYKALIGNVKNHKDALKGEDDGTNAKLWSICDLAMGIIMTKTTNYEMKDFPTEIQIPQMYFREHEDPQWRNDKVYLPIELQYQQPKKAGMSAYQGVRMGPPKTTKVDVSVDGEGGEGVSQTVIIEQQNVPAKRGRPPRGTHLPIMNLNLPGPSSEVVDLGEGELDLTSSGSIGNLEEEGEPAEKRVREEEDSGDGRPRRTFRK